MTEPTLIPGDEADIREDPKIGNEPPAEPADEPDPEDEEE